MMNNKPPVVLLGTDCMTGLQASRILWRKGVPVIGVADDVKRAYCRTRSVKRTIATTVIWDDPIPLLREISTQHNARPVILPCFCLHDRGRWSPAASESGGRWRH